MRVWLEKAGLISGKHVTVGDCTSFKTPDYWSAIPQSTYIHVADNVSVFVGTEKAEFLKPEPDPYFSMVTNGGYKYSPEVIRTGAADDFLRLWNSLTFYHHPTRSKKNECGTN